MEERKEVVLTTICELKQYIYKNSDGRTIINVVIETEEKGEGGDIQ